MGTKPIIGVLALQGDFAEHLAALKKIRIPGVAVRTVEDIKRTSGLIIPGGESTTIGKLLHTSRLDVWLKTHVPKGYAVYGTCAGAILLAKLGFIDIEVERNAYGRQLDSFDEPIEVKTRFIASLQKPLRGVFIRAPKITAVGKGVQILATHHGNPVLVQQGNILAGAFHPELTETLAVHQCFVDIARRYQRPNAVQHQKRYTTKQISVDR